MGSILAPCFTTIVTGPINSSESITNSTSMLIKFEPMTLFHSLNYPASELYALQFGGDRLIYQLFQFSI